MNTDYKLNNMAETSRVRSNIYGILSVIFRAEPAADLIRQIRDPQFLEVLSNAGIKLGEDFLAGPEEQILEDLAIEYTRLFLGPAKHISPHESIHHERDDGDWGTLWGKSTVEVKKFIESSGLEYKSDYHGMPDHISVELEFMQEAVKRENQAWEEQDNDGASYCLKMEAKFIEEHLVTWIPVFCDKVVAEAELSFYKEMARLTKYFLDFEKENINQYLAEAGG
jgi:TorA maturation chaperone TorD